MKFINKKRIASAALAGALALSMATPAFASGKTTTVTGNYKPITLAVTVPTTGKVIINPYGLPVQLDETTSISGQAITTGAPLTVQNRSSVPLGVTASITSAIATYPDGTPAAEKIEITTTAPTASTTSKAVQVKFQMFEADDLTAQNIEDTAVLNQKFAALDDTKALPAGGKVLDSTTAVSATGASNTPILVLREGNAAGELQAGGAAFFRLAGAAAKKPDNAWTAEDGFTATIAFTFEPSATAFSRPAWNTADAAVAALSTSSTTATAITVDTTKLTIPASAQTGMKYHLEVKNASDADKVVITDNDTTALPKFAKGTATGSVDMVLTITGADTIPYVGEFTITVS